jgi:hypothetical protein
MSIADIDKAIDEYVKASMDGAFPTGWVLVASVSSVVHDKYSSDGYTTITSDGLPHHVQLGLLQVAQFDKQSMSMIASMGSLIASRDEDDEWGDE